MPHGCQIKEDGSYLTDANKKDGGGALVVAPNGDLSVSTKIGKGSKLASCIILLDKFSGIDFSMQLSSH